MNLVAFLKEKKIYILCQVLMGIFLVLLFERLRIGHFAGELVGVTILIVTIISLGYEYIKKNRYYQSLYSTLSELEYKQYLYPMMEEPEFLEGEILRDIIFIISKAMNDEIGNYKIRQEEYEEYIETWIHEIKIPISTIELISENNKNDVTEKIMDELAKVEFYIDQALYYAKSNNLEEDYIIKKLKLVEVINSIVRNNSKQLIESHAEINLYNLDSEVFADSKWLDFIIGQVISNAIKYRHDKLVLEIFSQENKDNVVLTIKDNGIGIPSKDLNRIFKKGFTGENGRMYAKSTGMGLYLSKTLSEKMYLGLEVDSEVGQGTTVRIIFPKDRELIMLGSS